MSEVAFVPLPFMAGRAIIQTFNHYKLELSRQKATIPGTEEL
jgi:hypothetical protein